MTNTYNPENAKESHPMQIDIYLLTGEALSVLRQNLINVALELRKMGYSVWDDYTHHRYKMHKSIKREDMEERKCLIEASKCVLLYDYPSPLSPAVMHDLGLAIALEKPIIAVGNIKGLCLGEDSTVKKEFPWVTVENWNEMMKRIIAICGKHTPVYGVKKIERRSTLQHPDDPIPTDSNRTGLWGYCDKEGRTKCRFIYQFAYEFSDGMARVVLDEKFGFLGKTVRIAIEPQYQRARDFNCGLAPVAYKPNGDDSEFKWGYIDKKNNLSVPYLYDDARRFEDCGLALICLDGNHGLINTSGKIVLPLEYDYIVLDKFSEMKPGLICKDGLIGFVNTKGDVFISPQFEGTFGFSEGVAACKKGKEWFTIDLTGKRLVDLHYDEARYYSEGLLPVAHCIGNIDKKIGKEQKRYRWGFCDKEGNEVIPCEYDKVLPFSEGYAAACFHGKWGYIDHGNRVMIPFQYSFVADGGDEHGMFGRLADGVAKVGLGGQDVRKSQWGFFEINKLGQEFLDDQTLYRTPIYERGWMIDWPIYPLDYPREAIWLEKAGIWPKKYFITNILAALMKHRLKNHIEKQCFTNTIFKDVSDSIICIRGSSCL